MPRGLPDVVQRFGIDETDYERGKRAIISGAGEMADAHVRLIRLTQEFQDVLRRAQEGMNVPSWAKWAGEIQRSSQALEEYKAVVGDADAMSRKLIAANEALAKSAIESGDAMARSLEAVRKQAEDAKNVVYDLGAAHDILSGKLMRAANEHVTLGGMVRSLKDGVADLGGGMEYTVRNAAHLENVLRDTTVTTKMVGGEIVQTTHYIGDMNAAIREGTTLTSAAADKSRVSSIADDWMKVAAAYRTVEAAGRGISAAGMSLVAGGRGGIRGVDAALAEAAAGGGGGAAFISAMTGGGIPDRPPPEAGSAAAQFATIARFTRRWYPVAHWAMMLTNELLATAGPAVVAGGMGALVGMQGAEQVIPRLQSIFKTAESLGPSLGTTAGQFMGLKTPMLQNAQDLATGAAFGLTGAATRIVGTGGAGFVQLGSNTVAMWSRMAANLVTEFQSGLGKKLSDVVSGGTGYLQQFGNVLGNLGHVFLNMAPNLPGVGGDILSLLTGGTKAAAGITGWLGGALGPMLAFEAAARWGPGILGAVGRGVQLGGGKLVGLAGGMADTALAGLFTDAGAIDSAAVAKLARSASLGGIGTKIEGIGAGIGALKPGSIGALGATALLVGKALTYQASYQQQAAATQSAIDQMGFVQSILGVPGTPGIVQAMNQFAAVTGGPPRGLKAPFNLPVGGLDATTRQGAGNLFFGAGEFGAGIGQGRPGEIWHGIVRGFHGALQMLGSLVGMGPDPSAGQVAQQHLATLAGEFVHVLGAGKQVSDQWKQLGGGAVNMASAFQIATMAQLQLGNAFEKNGQLTKQAKQQIADLYAGYQPMVMNTGQFGAAVGVQTAMSGLQHTQVAAVNQASDQLMQIVTGGAAGAASLFGMLGGTPTTGFTRGGIRFAQTPGIKQFAAALASGVTTPQGAAAYNTFANQQSGMMAALQGQMDWLRTVQTMGGLTAGQTGQMGAFEIAQLLPLARRSPMALAMLSAAAQQFGGPGVLPGESAAASFKALSQWAGGQGTTAKGFNQLMTLGTQAVSNIPLDAQHFVQTTSDQLGPVLAQAVAQHGAVLQDKFMSSITGKGYSTAALGQYANVLQRGGFSLPSAQAIVKFAAQWSGASPQQISQMLSQVAKTYTATVKAKADTSEAAQSIKSLHGLPIPMKVTADAGAAKAAINSIQGKTVIVKAAQQGVGAVQSAINSVRGKTVTVTVNYVVTGSPGLSRLISSAGTVAALGGHTGPGMQTGGLVPGSGFGDIVPAMLEPGEAIVPRNLVPLIAPVLAMHGVPGFGRVPQRSSSHFADGGIVPPGASAAQLKALIRSEWKILDRLYAEKDAGQNVSAQIRTFWRTILDPLYAALDALKGKAGGASGALGAASGALKDVTVAVASQLPKSLKDIPSQMQKVAEGIVGKIQQEIAFAKNLSASTVQGLNLAGMTLPDPKGASATGVGAAAPGTRGFNLAAWNAAVASAASTGPAAPPAKSVQEQMKDYLASIKTFTSDVQHLSKAGLNKAVLQQILAAGPGQGHLLAASVLGGPGGVGAVNNLWRQINTAANKLGAVGAGAIFGGTLAPNLRSGTFISNNVSINISMGKGAGGDLGSLSASDLKKLVSLIEAKLLEQAKRNRKTGVQLKGYGA